MQTLPISAAEVRARLEPLNRKQLEALAATSAVPFGTLWKIRSGETGNPGVETVRMFFPHLPPVEPVDAQA